MDNNALELLKNLTDALNRAYISSWQSTAVWSKELEQANDYLFKLDNQIKAMEELRLHVLHKAKHANY